MTRKEEIERQGTIYSDIPTNYIEWSDGYDTKDDKAFVENAFIRGAKWADNSRPQSYSKQELREMGFAFDLNGNILSPNNLASKAAHYMIEKAEKWLENFLEKTVPEPSVDYGYTSDTIKWDELTRYRLIEEFLYDFKKAMEEQL